MNIAYSGSHPLEHLTRTLTAERDEWQTRAERAEAEAAELRNRAKVLEIAFANSHEVNEHAGDEIRALRAELDAAHKRIIQLVEYIMNTGGHVPFPPGASASDILGPLFAAPDAGQEPRP